MGKWKRYALDVLEPEHDDARAELAEARAEITDLKDEIERLTEAIERHGGLAYEDFLRLLIEILAASDHPRLGDACGEGACVLCWLEGQARGLQAELGDGEPTIGGRSANLSLKCRTCGKTSGPFWVHDGRLNCGCGGEVVEVPNGALVNELARAQRAMTKALERLTADGVRTRASRVLVAEEILREALDLPAELEGARRQARILLSEALWEALDVEKLNALRLRLPEAVWNDALKPILGAISDD